MQTLHTKLSGLKNVISTSCTSESEADGCLLLSSAQNGVCVGRDSCGVGRKVFSLRMNVKCSGNCELTFDVSELCSFDIGAPKSLFKSVLFY